MTNANNSNINFSNGIESLNEVMNKIHDLCLNQDFINASLKAAQKIGITAQEWNEFKPAILMKFALIHLENN
jgi:hypothetical protein